LNKTELSKECQRILYLYKTYTNIDEPDFKFLLEVLKNHPLWRLKAGVGVSAIQVRPNLYRTLSFFLIRTDGTFEEISFVKAINNKK
jgi:hypothetical protein